MKKERRRRGNVYYVLRIQLNSRLNMECQRNSICGLVTRARSVVNRGNRAEIVLPKTQTQTRNSISCRSYSPPEIENPPPLSAFDKACVPHTPTWVLRYSTHTS
nr:uncharacterized protein LOC118876821 [Drosophila suzukii]